MGKYGKIWDGVFNKSVEKNYSISFIITCMGRLYDLKKTLPLNIESNKSYPNLEFVIVDYNSKDELGEWVKNNMMEHIDSGRLSYYRTEEPTHFSMSHSRNIGFKVANGEIVNNIDADNYSFSGDLKGNDGWAFYLNKLANESNKNVIFAKGKRSMHGRIGFYKDEFINVLGGYDECLEGYGHDDHDLVQRAWGLGFTMYYWGGKYFGRLATNKYEKNKNMLRPWRETEKENKEKSKKNIDNKIFKANQNIHWGKANLIKNFKYEIKI